MARRGAVIAARIAAVRGVTLADATVTITYVAVCVNRPVSRAVTCNSYRRVPGRSGPK